VVRYQVDGPSNATIFDSELKLSNSNIIKIKKLGSLAPSQKINGTTINFGLYFASLSKVGLFDNSSGGELATNSLTNNYWPMIIILFFISVIILVLVLKLRNNKQKNNPKKDNANE
jgi:hypothetical protein